ncbi:hypothetical protein [Pedobacter sp. Leaf194]|uniref:hypothetical protein n=1 Tax=Pedobacter sp. Leaf194 TaxID=1736297 RepID=UPI000702E839|nr:hypothetical protein [Pedobacter sp. Leaf194]KQS36799.1 hypothetical protein ASG14_07115 [Pedobacter sp. Leaf194]
MKIDRKGDRVTFVSGKVSGEFDAHLGRFTLYHLQDTYFNDLPEPYFWRAPTDNDFGNGMPDKLGIWRYAHVDKLLKSVSIGNQDEHGLSIKVVSSLQAIGALYTLQYQILNDGSISVNASMDLVNRGMPELPRFGMRTQLDQRYRHLSYYGRGPYENYRDRNTAAFFGRILGLSRKSVF